MLVSVSGFAMSRVYLREFSKYDECASRAILKTILDWSFIGFDFVNLRNVFQNLPVLCH